MKQAIHALIMAAMLPLAGAAGAAATLTGYSLVYLNYSDGTWPSTVCNLPPCSGSTPLEDLDGGLTGYSLSYETSVSAAFGKLKAYARSSISRTPDQEVGNDAHATSSLSYADASWRDQWVASSGGLTGPGTLQLEVSLTGTLGLSGSGAAISAGVYIYNLTTGRTLNWIPSLYNELRFMSPTNPIKYIFDIPVVFGEELDLQMRLHAGSGLFDLEADGAFSFMNLGNTAEVTAIVVKDATGNVVPFTLSTTSGSALFGALVPDDRTVPEPSVLTLLLFGLAMPVVTRMRRV